MVLLSGLKPQELSADKPALDSMCARLFDTHRCSKQRVPYLRADNVPNDNKNDIVMFKMLQVLKSATNKVNVFKYKYLKVRHKDTKTQNLYFMYIFLNIVAAVVVRFLFFL